MKRRLVALCLSIGLPLSSAVAAAEETNPVRVPIGSAFTVGAGRWDLGLLSGLRVGLSDRAQLSTQPVTLWLYPHVDLQYRWLRHGSLTLATQLRLAYPTRLLQSVAREGTLGLLPATSKIPPMIGVHGKILATHAIAGAHWLTSSAAVATAPRLGHGNFAVLDFPFLYSRFAHTKTVATAHFGLALHGWLSPAISYRTDITHSILPLPRLRSGFATEQSAWLGWHCATRWVISAGECVSVAHLPVGLRMHYLPMVDLRVGF